MLSETATLPAPASAADADAPPHALPAAELMVRLDVAPARGLTQVQCVARRAAHGPNTIAARRKASALALLVHQFASPVVYLLAGAASLAAWFGDWAEAGAIVLVLVLNALIGFATEIKAARSIEALRALGTRSARVRRDGRVLLVPAEDLVPGDLVLLEAGDGIPADLRIVEGSNLAADESTLTGESVPVEKAPDPVAPDAPLGARTSMLFMGTALTRGGGLGLVVATGLATELGRITALVEEARPDSSPLEKRLARLSQQLVWTVGGLTIVIAAIGLARGKEPLLMVESAIALAVAAIPEGLPIVATLALARGVWRMAQQNALVERLAAVETLGATTIILTDKTGTLTRNRMAVRRLVLAAGVIDVASEGAPVAPPGAEAALARLIEVCVLANDADLDPATGAGTGDPMEIALLRLGAQARHAPARAARAAAHAFDAATRMAATVHPDGDGFLFAVKGAPEAVLAACDFELADGAARRLGPQARAGWSERVEALGTQGLRVIACAVRTDAWADAAPYEGLTLVGLVGLEDPPRPDVPAAIADCRRAGIRVVMVTGDHAVTARAIARQVGLAPDGADIAVAEGRAVGELVREGAVSRVDVFARVNPSEKLDLVRAWQKAGAVVAMTGDGVNDAPALKQADIGVAMGQRGTDVAREAAAMILMDDAFPTIVKAIREGRVIFANIRRLVAFLLACNLSEVLVVGIAVLSTLPLPILPLQILYLNLVTDVFPAFALALGEGDRHVLDRAPRDPKEPLLGRRQWRGIVLHAGAITLATFSALGYAVWGLRLDGAGIVTVSFLTLAFAQLWHVFNMRQADAGLVRNEITANGWVWGALALCTGLLAIPPYVPPLAGVLQLVPPDAAMWTAILGFSLLPLALGEAGRALTALGRGPSDAQK